MPRVKNRYLYWFQRYNRLVSFGPYETEHEAQAAFQRAYGYWPPNAERIEDYHV